MTFARTHTIFHRGDLLVRGEDPPIIVAQTVVGGGTAKSITLSLAVKTS
jgi:hypothetical protein